VLAPMSATDLDRINLDPLVGAGASSCATVLVLAGAGRVMTVLDLKGVDLDLLAAATAGDTSSCVSVVTVPASDFRVTHQ
jgi:hypothetical protein